MGGSRLRRARGKSHVLSGLGFATVGKIVQLRWVLCFRATVIRKRYAGTGRSSAAVFLGWRR